MAATASKEKTNGKVEDAAFEPITLERVQKFIAVINIAGVTPVIPHRFAEKAKRMMLDKQKGKASPKKAPKDPAQDAYDSSYWLDDGRPGIQAVAFKGAIADAARYFDKSVSMELLKRAIHVFGEVNERGEVLVPIVGEVTMREDIARNSGGVADVRHRNQIWPWAAELHIEFVASLISHPSLVVIVDAAGLNGVGDWRPSAPKSKTGTFGKFQVVEGGADDDV